MGKMDSEGPNWFLVLLFVLFVVPDVCMLVGSAIEFWIGDGE